VKLEPEIHIAKLASPEFSFIEDETTIHLGEIQTSYIVKNYLTGQYQYGLELNTEKI
jgi:hypothetical protein